MPASTMEKEIPPASQAYLNLYCVGRRWLQCRLLGTSFDWVFVRVDEGRNLCCGVRPNLLSTFVRIRWKGRDVVKGMVVRSRGGRKVAVRVPQQGRRWHASLAKIDHQLCTCHSGATCGREGSERSGINPGLFLQTPACCHPTR